MSLRILCKNITKYNFLLDKRRFISLSVANLYSGNSISFKRNFNTNMLSLLRVTLTNRAFEEPKRNFSKKKKPPKKEIEDEESDTDDDEDYSSIQSEEGMEDEPNAIRKMVPSLRIDTILKAGLGTSKKKIEKEFYAARIRVNEEPVLKKATMVISGDEVDLIKGFSPENSKLLIVDRVMIKSIDKISGTGNYPVNLLVFKSLTIENYPKPWAPSSSSEVD
ncbi:mitochondrial transcription rescue factor 1-like [Uloborus diversus]|uniref:mitochondrial transcription rescue factor 1-like n=1 Tax=Uloborus diversus TaxID=327109 RepID=UPI002409FF5C|nr:mitochondrial transcription rescue factor 1-like [Uloborus diversus]